MNISFVEIGLICGCLPPAIPATVIIIKHFNNYKQKKNKNKKENTKREKRNEFLAEYYSIQHYSRFQHRSYLCEERLRHGCARWICARHQGAGWDSYLRCSCHPKKHSTQGDRRLKDVTTRKEGHNKNYLAKIDRDRRRAPFRPRREASWFQVWWDAFAKEEAQQGTQK